MKLKKKMGTDPKKRRKQYIKNLWRHRELYLFMLPAILATFIFAYIPMYGVFMAFQDVKISNPIFQNQWVGFAHFQRFFNSMWFPIVMKNTILLALVQNILLWPIPILLALLLHNSRSQIIKKFTQMTTYLPYLLSVVVVVSIVNLLCNGETGLINILIKRFGGDRINFFGEPQWVLPMYIISSIWTSAGQGAIVYLAALSSVDEDLIEAAQIDGAGMLKRIWHIQLPSIMPTLATMLILNVGKAFAIGADKMLLLQTNLNLTSSEIISTYVYKSGFISNQYGFSSAVGIFQNVINVVLLLTVNKITKKLTEVSVL